MRGLEPSTKGAETYTVNGVEWTVSYHHDRPRAMLVVEKVVREVTSAAHKRPLAETTTLEQDVAAQRGGETVVCATRHVVGNFEGEIVETQRLMASTFCRSDEPYQPGVGRMLGLARILFDIVGSDGTEYEGDKDVAAAWSAYFERHPADRRLSRYAHEIDDRVPDVAPTVARILDIDFSAETRATLRAGRAQRKATKKALRSGPLDFGTAASDCGLE